MFTVKADPVVLEKLADLLRQETPDACIRLKEYTLGGGLHARKMLGPGIDVQDEARDALYVIGGVPFIASKELCDSYGDTFALLLINGHLQVTRT